MGKIAALLGGFGLLLLVSAARVTIPPEGFASTDAPASDPTEEDWLDAIERRALARVGSRGVEE